jgi:outer membrane putative beta-barrel porin/alpha-amylase
MMAGRHFYFAAILSIAIAVGAASSAAAQTTTASASPTLAELLRNIYGPRGLIVDSENVLPDGSTHSAHFNGAFQSEFERFNIALVRQLAALPVPSPASGFTYEFDASTGTFARTTQSFGPILADRAETVGRGKFVFGYSLQQFDFTAFDGLRLSHIPAIFKHDEANLGGGRADIITTETALKASVTQSTSFFMLGATDRLDVSLAVPIVRTSLSILSDATIHRIGTASIPATHFFRDPAAPGTFGTQRRFIAQGSEHGLGDVVVRAKTKAIQSKSAVVAVGLEARLPTGRQEGLLGSGSFGLKLFEATSLPNRTLTPHFGVGYQWNTATVLAGDITTGQKGDLPNELTYYAGADTTVSRRVSIAFDLLGRVSPDSPRLTATPFAAQDGLVYSDIAFNLAALHVVNGAVGMKVNAVSTLLVTFNMLFRVNKAGLRTKATPLIGMEYGF